MRFILLIILFLSSSLIGQDASSKIYWNSLATAVNIGVPLEDDKTLKGGRIQIRVSFDQGKSFSEAFAAAAGFAARFRPPIKGPRCRGFASRPPRR